eukprot:1612040-Rhodomonas_salina.4
MPRLPRPAVAHFDVHDVGEELGVRAGDRRAQCEAHGQHGHDVALASYRMPHSQQRPSPRADQKRVKHVAQVPLPHE